MKKRINFVLISIFAILLSVTIVSAVACSPTVSLINQDPYPAIPGEYVKFVFQIGNIANPECASLTFELLNKYPLIFDPDTNPIVSLDTGFYQRIGLRRR